MLSIPTNILPRDENKILSEDENAVVAALVATMEFYRETGSNDGYILIIDFKGYFDNILHDPLKKLIDGGNYDLIVLSTSFESYYQSYRNRTSGVKVLSTYFFISFSQLQCSLKWFCN